MDEATKDQKNYNPIEDEKKEFSLEEFKELAKAELDKYAATFEGQNDFHKGKHTWGEWFSSFHRYMSW